MLCAPMQAHGSFIHVFLVGTRVKHRNKGMGAALLEHINRYADERRMHCYLEVSHRGSVPLMHACIWHGHCCSN